MMEFVSVPSGVYEIGLELDTISILRSQVARDIGEHFDACQKRFVKIETFNIAKYCVSNEEFKEYTDSHAITTLPRFWYKKGTFRQCVTEWPVVGICYEDARKYAIWRCCTLPTIEQWEVFSRLYITDIPEYEGLVTDYGHMRNVSSVPVLSSDLFNLYGNVSEYTNSTCQENPNIVYAKGCPHNMRFFHHSRKFSLNIDDIWGITGLRLVKGN